MVAVGLVPNSVTFNTLIHGYSKEGNVRRAESFLAQMKRRGLTPNVITYNSLIHGFCKAGKLLDAIVVFEEMQEKVSKAFNSIEK